MPRLFLLCVIFFCVFSVNAQPEDSLLYQLMSSQATQFAHILQNPDRYEVQIMYTQIFRDSLNQPTLKNHSYHLLPDSYFNPASLVKLPVSAMALEKLGEIHVPGVNKFARMGTDSSYSCQSWVRGDDPEDEAYPCIARYIEKMMLVSDNESYTRIFEFLGPSYIERKLHDKCFQQMRIVRRFADCDSSENRYTNAVRFYNQDLKEIYYQGPQFNASEFCPPLGRVEKGKAYITSKWKTIYEPKDFTYSNYVTLEDMHQILIDVIMPEQTPEVNSFKIREGDREFLIRSMGAYPREGEWSDYQPKKGYYDTFKKYLYYGRAKRAVNPNLRIFNVVGWWEGYLSDCAYFVDMDKGVEFFLSAVVYVNRNQRFDYKFEYAREGFPFMANLGQLIYNYERSLQKAYKPDLSYFDFY